VKKPRGLPPKKFIGKLKRQPGELLKKLIERRKKMP
jgi:hypothetical protein